MTNVKTTINWGIIGPGKIAHKFAKALAIVEDAKLFAVASRSIERATKFKKEYGATHAYNSYQDLLQNPNIDIVYIATTNNLHFEHAKLCLEHKKACLVEKPFTLKSTELKELVTLAKKNNVFLMEALWTRFLPSIYTVEKEFTKSSIGEITRIEADFGFKVSFDKNSRLFSPDLGGGALWDIGIYPVFFALHFLGKPENIQVNAELTNEGVDIDEEIIFTYKNNVKAFLKASFTKDLPCEATIFGTKGYVKLERMWHCPTQIYAQIGNRKINLTPNYVGNGYNYEIQEAQNCLRNNLTESSTLPLKTSVKILQTLEYISKNW